MKLRMRIEELETDVAELRGAVAVVSERDSLLDAVDAFIAELEPDGTIVYLNRASERPAANVVGSKLEDWIAPVFVPFAKRALEQLIATGAPTRFECQRHDGIWFEVRLSPIDRGGDVVRVALTGHDISDRRDIDDQLARSVRAHAIRGELRGLMLEATDEGELFESVRHLLEVDGGFAGVFAGSVDPGAIERCSRREGEPEGPVAPMIAEALRTHESIALARPASAGEPADGPRAPWIGPGLAVPICDGPHAIGILVAYASNSETIDDTDKWLLSDVARDLAHGVRAMRARGERRTMEELLFQAQKMDAVGQLAGGVAHDFNNQLTGILGFAEFLSLQLEDPGLREQAQLIVRAAERSADLTAQLLAFARKGPFRSVSFDVHAVIRDVVAILERSIDKRIRIRTELESTRPFVQGDPHQLQNALLNLALNARDAMPNGGDVRLVTRDQSDGVGTDAPRGEGESLLCLEVVDRGTGISSDVRARMFEPFFTTKPAGKGTGMGLAAVYGTVQRHGGHLEVETAEGAGSTFRVLLPATSEPRELDTSRSLAPPSAGPPARILVVDDEPVVCRLIESALEEHGYEVFAFTRPDEALRFFDENATSIDLVLLDMIMPQMNGRETFEALRERRSDVRVLLVSGYSLDDEAQTLLGGGAVGFLQKPFPVRQLAHRVAKALVRIAPATDGL